jgi:hypothetical protein
MIRKALPAGWPVAPLPRRGTDVGGALWVTFRCGGACGAAGIVRSPDRDAEHRDICCEGKAAGVRLHSDFDQSCKVLAFSWDHRRHESANFVNINFRGSR